MKPTRARAVLNYATPGHARRGPYVKWAFGVAGFVTSLFSGVVALVILEWARGADLPLLVGLIPLMACAAGAAYAQWRLQWTGFLPGAGIGLGVILLGVLWLEWALRGLDRATQ